MDVKNKQGRCFYLIHDGREFVSAIPLPPGGSHGLVGAYVDDAGVLRPVLGKSLYATHIRSAIERYEENSLLAMKTYGPALIEHDRASLGVIDP